MIGERTNVDPSADHISYKNNKQSRDGKYMILYICNYLNSLLSLIDMDQLELKTDRKPKLSDNILELKVSSYICLKNLFLLTYKLK